MNGFYDAVNKLNSADRNLSQEAGKYLETFQASVEAWTVADKVLAEGRSHVACLFAAQTLRRKMVKDFGEIPDSAKDSLRDSIVNHLSNVESKLGAQYQTVATQLCVALADLYLQVPQWNNFIGHLLNQFAGLAQNDIKCAHILLELFKVFPEELKNEQIKIGDNRRKAVQTELANQTEAVLLCLESICKTANQDLQTKAITTLGSWLTNKQCPSIVINNSFFFQSILDCLQNPHCPNDVHFAATTTICQALQFVENVEEHHLLAGTLMKNLHKTVHAFEAAFNEEDGDKMNSYGRLYSELCIMLLEPLVNSPGHDYGDLKSLELLLKASEFHDYSVCETTFDIWYRLSEALYYLSEEEFKEKAAVYKPLVVNYVKILYKHCRFDTETDRMPSSNDEFIDFRYLASESIKDIAFIYGTLDLIEAMIDEIASTVSRPGTWDEIEAGLFIIKAVSTNITQRDETVTPKVVNIILQVPTNANAIFLQTTIELIGELNDWLSSRHMELVQCTDWLLNMSPSVSLLKPWSYSIQQLTSSGYQFLGDNFEKIYSVLNAVDALDGSPKDLDEVAQEITKAATNLLNDRPSGEIAQGLATLLSKPLEYLQRRCGTPQLIALFDPSQHVHQSKETFLADPMVWLDRITCVYRVLKPWHDQRDYRQSAANSQVPHISAPWTEHSVKVAETINLVFNTFKEHARVMEHCCRAVRFVVRSMGEQSVNFIPQLVQQLVHIYNEYPHSCLLYLSSVIVDENGRNPQLEEGLITLLKYLAPKTFEIIESPNGAKNSPGTVDDFFRLCIRYCHRMPVAFIREPIVEKIFEIALHLLEFDHQEANKSTALFLEEILKLAYSQRVPPYFAATRDTATGLVKKYGPKLVWHCIHASVFKVPSAVRYDIAGLLKLLNENWKQEMQEWLPHAIGMLPRDSGLSATTAQLTEFKDSLLSCTKQFEINNQLTDLSRFYT